ncbi:MAG: hypothetical protein EOP92_32090 [Lysobacteraceae bacterium]|nr:MAG: hypothetical protein EOP92_32090 [Xanthomonadaceae bacterium]
MKFINKLILIIAPFGFLVANAYAETAGECGTRFSDPCPLPEPGTPYLIVGAIAVAALVVKLRNKK